MQNKFFGSKLNTVLLLILIILMVFAIKIMKQNKEMYLGVWQKPIEQTNDDWKKYPLNTTVGYHPCGTDPNANDCLSDSVFQKVLGNKEDLISFSIIPGQEVSGKTTVTGTLKGAYFFEANLLVGILDASKNATSYGPGHANATTDWMTAGPVSFAFDIDFSEIPKGNYYIQLTQDDPSDGESGRPIKFVTIPIVIK